MFGKNVTDFLLVLFPAGIHQFFMNRILSFYHTLFIRAQAEARNNISIIQLFPCFIEPCHTSHLYKQSMHLVIIDKNLVKLLFIQFFIFSSTSSIRQMVSSGTFPPISFTAMVS